MHVLKSMAMREAIDFIAYIDEQDMDDKRYQQYLRTDMSMSFDDFKTAQGYISHRKQPKVADSSVGDEQLSIDFAKSFIKSKEPEKE